MAQGPFEKGKNKMTDAIDAFDEQQIPAGDISSLVTSAKELVTLEDQIEDVEQMLKKIKERANELKTKIIPDKMSELGLSDFTTNEGERIKIGDFVAGSLPKDEIKKKTALAAIEEMGGKDIIKNEIIVSFKKSQHNEAMALAVDLQQKGFVADVKSAIHPQTYLAFIRERLKKGEAVDTDRLSVFVGRSAKVETIKKEKI